MNRNNKIILNVGGKIYETTKLTLTKQSGSIFDMILKDDIILDEKGHIFIDRDGDLFKFILNGLRNGIIIPPDDFGKNFCKSINLELIYYKLIIDIEGNKEIIKQKTENDLGKIEISKIEDNKIYWSCDICRYNKNYKNKILCYKCGNCKKGILEKKDKNQRFTIQLSEFRRKSEIEEKQLKKENYKYFDWANGWKYKPKDVKNCEELKHKRKDNSYSIRGSHNRIICEICKYYYDFDCS